VRGCALPANAESPRVAGEIVSLGSGARTVNATGTLSVSPGVCGDVKAIVSWCTTWDSVPPTSTTTRLSGAAPVLGKSVSQGAVAVAVHDSVAPSALASRSVALTVSGAVACVVSRIAAGLTTSRSWIVGLTSLSIRHVATDIASTKTKQPVTKRMAAGLTSVWIQATSDAGRVTAKSR